MRHVKKRSKVNLQFNRDVPNVQWWDAPLLSEKTYLEALNLGEDVDFDEKIKTVSTFKW